MSTPVYGVVYCAECDRLIPDGQAFYEGARGLICEGCWENDEAREEEQDDGRDRA